MYENYDIVDGRRQSVMLDGNNILTHKNIVGLARIKEQDIVNLTDEQMAEIEAALADMNESIASAEAKLAEVKAEAKAKAESALKQLKEELVSEHKVTVTVQ